MDVHIMWDVPFFMKIDITVKCELHFRYRIASVRETYVLTNHMCRRMVVVMVGV